MSEGQLNGCVTICPWHGAELDVTSGKLLSGPGVRDVEAFEVNLDCEVVMVLVDD